MPLYRLECRLIDVGPRYAFYGLEHFQQPRPWPDRSGASEGVDATTACCDGERDSLGFRVQGLGFRAGS